MMNTGILTKDLGTILVGQEAVDKGLVNGVGGIKEAFAKMQELMYEKEKNMTENIVDKEMSECKLCPRNCKKTEKIKKKATAL